MYPWEVAGRGAEGEATPLPLRQTKEEAGREALLLLGAAAWAEVAPLLMPSLRMLPEKEEEERGASFPQAAAELSVEESRPKEPRRGQGEAAAGLMAEQHRI